MLYLQLFYEFFKTGLFAIGGGLATLPFLYDMADKYPWFTRTDLANMIAVSESTPGPIGVNMATYVGFTTGGILGSIIATCGLVLPSLIIIIIIAKFLESFQDNRFVQSAFYGLRPVECCRSPSLPSTSSRSPMRCSISSTGETWCCLPSHWRPSSKPNGIPSSLSAPAHCSVSY